MTYSDFIALHSLDPAVHNCKCTLKTNRKCNILGTEYTIIRKAYSDYPEFKEKNICGKAETYTKEIIVGDMVTFPDWKNDSPETIASVEKSILRHEIIHAFLSESGLEYNALCCDGSWAVNEEMVDWVALQSPKIYKVFTELDIL